MGSAWQSRTPLKSERDHAGRRADTFDEILPVGSPIRQCWDLALAGALARGETTLVQVKVGADPEPFKWFWEAMIGHISRPERFAEWYALGRAPGPVDLVRAVRPKSQYSSHQGPDENGNWRVGVLKVESDDLIIKAADLLSAFLDYSQAKSLARLDIAPIPSYTGDNELEVVNALRAARVGVVEIIAHGCEEDPTLLQTRSGLRPWQKLVSEIGTIGTINVALLSWCYSDFFLPVTLSPAAVLLEAGVRAVIPWSPKPQLYSLVPFHRGFYGALLGGAHVARACSIGRTSIFHALNLGDGEKWLDAAGPRLYMRDDLRGETDIRQLRLPPRGLPRR